MGPGYRHVACCVEGSLAHKAVVAAGMRMLADKDATLTLLHVVTQPIAMMATPAPDISGLFDSAEHWLKDTVNETQAALHAAGSTSKVDGVLLEGHPGISVVSWARDPTSTWSWPPRTGATSTARSWGRSRPMSRTTPRATSILYARRWPPTTTPCRHVVQAHRRPVRPSWTRSRDHAHRG